MDANPGQLMLAVVIPVFNEEEIIAEVIRQWTERLKKLAIDFQLHAYNDGSKDKTIRVLREIAFQNPYLIVHDKPNSGHGPTILSGYRESSDAAWIFQVDSDNEMRPEYFDRLWEKRKDFDLLVGSRQGKKSPLSRRVVTEISRAVVRLLYGRGVRDVNAPYRLMRTSCFKDFFFSLPPDTFAPNVILSGIAGLKKFRIWEGPVPCQVRQTGEVSIKKLKLFKVALWSLIQTIYFRFSGRITAPGEKQ